MWQRIKDLLEIRFWKLAKWIIRKGYGADCEESDIDEELFSNPKEMRAYLTSTSRCASCRAKEVIDWIDHHIDLIRM
jgi:hypothetical protein